MQRRSKGLLTTHGLAARPAQRGKDERSGSRGFSLIELLISLAVLGLISFFLTDLLVRQSRTYTVVDNVAEDTAM